MKEFLFRKKLHCKIKLATKNSLKIIFFFSEFVYCSIIFFQFHVFILFYSNVDPILYWMQSQIIPFHSHTSWIWFNFFSFYLLLFVLFRKSFYSNSHKKKQRKQNNQLPFFSTLSVNQLKCFQQVPLDVRCYSIEI